MTAATKRSDHELIQALDALHQRVSFAQREMFTFIAEVDRREAWRNSGARDRAHFIRMRYGISDWKARRWIAAALEDLPHIAEAVASGVLGIDI